MKNEQVAETANKSRQFDLEDRLVDFACMCLEVCELCPQAGQGKTWNTNSLIAGQRQHLSTGRLNRLSRELILCIKCRWF